MTRARLLLLLPAAAFLALPASSPMLGCGGDELATGPTSVFLTIRNAPGTAFPDQVVIESHHGGGLGLIKSTPKFVTTAPVGDLIGNVTVYPPPGVASLRIVVWGLLAGATISTGETLATITTNKQSTATVVLSRTVRGDGGPMITQDAGADAAADVGGRAGMGTGGMGGIGGMATGGVGGMATGGIGGTTPALRGLGVRCDMANQCRSGFCIGGLCCDQACQGACRTCLGAQPGICSNLAENTECGDAQCHANNSQLRTFACDANGGCQMKNQRCSVGMCIAANQICQ